MLEPIKISYLGRQDLHTELKPVRRRCKLWLNLANRVVMFAFRARRLFWVLGVLTQQVYLAPAVEGKHRLTRVWLLLKLLAVTMIDLVASLLVFIVVLAIRFAIGLVSR